MKNPRKARREWYKRRAMEVALRPPKSEWGDGPWQTEPDFVRWTDGATGLHCYMVRSFVGGTLGGYVRLPIRHPWYGVPSLGRRLLRNVEVHGGVTWAGRGIVGTEG